MDGWIKYFNLSYPGQYCNLDGLCFLNLRLGIRSDERRNVKWMHYGGVQWCVPQGYTSTGFCSYMFSCIIGFTGGGKVDIKWGEINGEKINRV